MIIWYLFCKVPLVDKSLVMNVYKVYNMHILHPVLQNTFQYYIEGENPALSLDDDNATLPSQKYMLTYVFTEGHMC